MAATSMVCTPADVETDRVRKLLAVVSTVCVVVVVDVVAPAVMVLRIPAIVVPPLPVVRMVSIPSVAIPPLAATDWPLVDTTGSLVLLLGPRCIWKLTAVAAVASCTPNALIAKVVPTANVFAGIDSDTT
jgi:hypothetical protein